MKSPQLPQRRAGAPQWLFAILILFCTRAVLAQDESGYWDDRFGPPGSFYGIGDLAADSNGVYAVGGVMIPSDELRHAVVKWDRLTKSWRAFGEEGLRIGRTGSALALTKNALYIGGVNVKTNKIESTGIAKWDLIRKAWANIGKGVNGTVSTIVVEGENVYVAGFYLSATDWSSSWPRSNRIAKWDGTTWSDLPGEIHGDVHAMVMSDNVLYVAGQFDSIGAVQAKNVARWNGKRWHPVGNGINGRVYALATSGKEIYAGGRFTQAGRFTVRNLAKWDGVSWSNFGVASGSSSAVVHAIIVGPRGEIYIGGEEIKEVGGVPVSNVARWNGAHWSALDGGINGNVRALALGGGVLYAGGYFTSAGGVAAKNIAQMNAATNLWSALLQNKYHGVEGKVTAMAARGNEVCISGPFASAGPRLANGIAKWNGKNWQGLGKGVDGLINALAFGDRGEVYAGGKFSMAGSVRANNVAKWNGVKWEALGSGLNGTVKALAVGNKGVFAAGVLYSAAGRQVPLAKWDGHTWQVPWFFGRWSEIYAIAAEGDNLYISVQFEGIYKWNGDTLNRLEGKINGPVQKILLDAGNVYIIGDFTKIDDLSFSGLAKWDGERWTAIGRDGILRIDHIAAAGGELYAAGHVQNISKMTRNGLAKWNGARWVKLGVISDYYDEGRYWDGDCLALAASGDKVYLGGAFNYIHEEKSSTTISSNFAIWHNSTSRLKPVQNEATPTTSGAGKLIPTELVLLQNYPNPVSGYGAAVGATTAIRFGLPASSRIKLAVYNLCGELVRHLADGEMPAGYHQIYFNARGLASGVYFYRLEAGARTEMRKLILQK